MPEPPAALGCLIDEGAASLRRCGVAEPRREAVRIWADIHQGGAAEVHLRRDLPVATGSAAHFQSAILRRCGGEPVAHVTGWSGFRRLWLRSDRRALIPRPETEGLVDLILQLVRSGTVADVGTGTGCIALSLAHEGGFDHIVAVDCSSDALKLARANRELVGGPVTLVQADLCASFRPGTLDALVSNPPYLSAAEYSSLDHSVLNWEPALALLSGEDGMEATFRLLVEGREVLREGGWLALEVDSSRAAMAARRACELGWGDVAVQVDLFGRERYLLARRSNAS
ncbi:MAG: peptide chain release factor N(5)-glutamine methyltransferase [Gemmatimonadales bacterium]